MAISKFMSSVFEGLNAHAYSNKYCTMQRASDDGEKIVVKVDRNQVFQTRYGFGLILNAENVVWLKSWQVSDNYYGVEVLLNKAYFNPAHSSILHDDYGYDAANLDWQVWVDTAKAQDEQMVTFTDDDGEEYQLPNMVRWAM